MSKELTSELLEKARGGDRSALGSLLVQQLPWLKDRVAKYKKLAGFETDDIVQTAALRFIQNPPEPMGTSLSAFRKQLEKAAYNFSSAQNNTASRRLTGMHRAAERASVDSEVVQSASRSEQYAKLRSAIRSLSEADQEILSKHLDDDRSIRQIASETSTPTSTIQGRLESAKKRLLKFLVWTLAALAFAGAAYVATKLLTATTGGVTHQSLKPILPNNEQAKSLPTHEAGDGTHEPAVAARDATSTAAPALEEAATFHGFVSDARTKSPIPGVQFKLVENEGPNYKTQASESDSSGHFAFSALGPGRPGVLHAESDGYSVHVLRVTSSSAPVLIELESECLVRGAVLRGGAPVANAPLVISGSRETSYPGIKSDPPTTWLMEFVRFSEIKTDRDGRFKIGSLYRGEFTITAYDPDDYENKVSISTESYPASEQASMVAIELGN